MLENATDLTHSQNVDSAKYEYQETKSWQISSKDFMKQKNDQGCAIRFQS